MSVAAPRAARERVDKTEEVFMMLKSGRQRLVGYFE